MMSLIQIVKIIIIYVKLQNTLVNHTPKKKGNNRYKEINQFCIQFIPDKSNNQKKYTCNEIREKLFSCLEYITIKENDGESEYNSLIRGNKMHGEYVDGTLNFFVNYDMFVKKKEIETDKMDSCEYNSTIMEG